MISLKEFKNFRLENISNIFGGETSGSGTCNTSGGEHNCGPGESDCTSYTYSDTCDGDRTITSSETYDGGC